MGDLPDATGYMDVSAKDKCGQLPPAWTLTYFPRIIRREYVCNCARIDTVEKSPPQDKALFYLGVAGRNNLLKGTGSFLKRIFSHLSKKHAF